MKKIIPFLTFCLVATCNAELRTWTAVNGKEVAAEFVSNEEGVVKLKLKSGKVFEVPANKLSKEDNVFINYLSTSNSVNEKGLEFRGGNAPWNGGVAYLIGTNILFTGKAFSTHQNGEKRSEMYIKDGNLKMVSAWYENGQIKSEAFWENGKINGSNSVWHENGHKKFEIKMIDGTPDGVANYWYDNGQKEQKMSITRGVENGPSTKWYRNGKKKFEGIAKNGKPHGIFSSWHENGQKAMELIYNNGELVKNSDKYWNSKGEPVDSREEAESEN